MTSRQEAALKAGEDAFTVIVQCGYAVGLDARWLQLARWHATERVDQLLALSEGLVPIKGKLTEPSSSAKVGRGRRKRQSTKRKSAKPQAAQAKFIESMECLGVTKLPEGPEWTYEIRLDGYRLEAVKGAK